jgi:release factor glutamine methyltransferase
MTIQQVYLAAIAKLQKVKNTSPHLDAGILLAHVLHKTKEYVLANPDKKMSVNQTKKLNALILRRQKNIPIAYLTGQKEFYGLHFFVGTFVLVPRPETELLIEETIKTVRQKTDQQKVTITDVGTGSGCIAITLAKYLPQAKIIAIDISPKALAMAKKNARQHKVFKKIKFIESNLLRTPILKKIKMDIIVANLPYLTNAEIKNVRHEPKLALYGGKMGVELIERLLMQSSEVLTPNGVILLEISPSQTKLVDFIIEQQIPGKKVTIFKDLTGRDRVVKIG